MTASPLHLAYPGDDAIAGTALRRVSLRLLPFLFVLYLLNFLDRTNVGLAALQMNRDLRFSDAAYGVGAGIFFVGYALLEVPSNVILARVGARRWIARIMISWGVIATLMMFVRTPLQFYIARFLLGVAEAGFFPGIVYYLTQWFPERQRARAISGFMVAIPVSSAVGNAIGGALLGLDGWHGLAGWQWLFLLEGLPSVVIGVTVLWWLTDRPEDAHWLPPAEREWLVARLARERATAPLLAGHDSALSALTNPLVWLLALPYFMLQAVAYVYVFWAPTLFKAALDINATQVGLMMGLIGLLAVGVMVAIGVSADRRGEHILHVAAGAFGATCGLLLMVLVDAPWAPVVGFALLIFGTTGVLPAYWTIPGLLLRGRSAAAGIAFVNSLGSVGGMVGPSAMGAIRNATGSPQLAYVAMAGATLVMCAACLVLRSRLVLAQGTSARTTAEVPA